MKFKYYLRGAGVGVLVTTFIFVIALAFHTSDMSDDEIIAKAKQLGMVMAEDSSSNNEYTKTTDDSNKNTTEDNSQDSEGADTQTTEYENFEVASGEDSGAIVTQLYEQGFIDSEDAFNSYLNDNGYDSQIQPGTVSLYKGMTYDEIAGQLITKPENRVAQ